MGRVKKRASLEIVGGEVWYLANLETMAASIRTTPNFDGWITFLFQEQEIRESTMTLFFCYLARILRNYEFSVMKLLHLFRDCVDTLLTKQLYPFIDFHLWQQHVLNEGIISIVRLIEFYHCIDINRVAGEDICGIAISFCMIGEVHGFNMKKGVGITLSWICGDDDIRLSFVVINQAGVACLSWWPHISAFALCRYSGGRIWQGWR